MELWNLFLNLDLHFLLIFVCIFSCFTDLFLELVALGICFIDESPCFLFFANQFVLNAQTKDPTIELDILFHVLVVCVDVVERLDLGDILVHFLRLLLDDLYLLLQPCLLELDSVLDGGGQELFDLQQILLWRVHFVFCERFLDGSSFHPNHANVLVLGKEVLVLFFLCCKSVEQRLNDLSRVLEVV